MASFLIFQLDPSLKPLFPFHFFQLPPRYQRMDRSQGQSGLPTCARTQTGGKGGLGWATRTVQQRKSPVSDSTSYNHQASWPAQPPARAVIVLSTFFWTTPSLTLLLPCVSTVGQCVAQIQEIRKFSTTFSTTFQPVLFPCKISWMAQYFNISPEHKYLDLILGKIQISGSLVQTPKDLLGRVSRNSR